jgi:hypothetical protein
MTDRAKGNGRKQLILMLLIAGASLGGSWALFLTSQSGGLWGTTNKGTFVDPPVHISDLELVDANGIAPSGAETWWLWVVREEPCNVACLDAMHQLRQLHILLHREADRVRRALVTPGPVDPGELDELYPDLAFLTGRVEGLAPGIYIVDPLGNLVLHYPLEAAGKPVLEDLKRLLKVSQIG